MNRGWSAFQLFAQTCPEADRSSVRLAGRRDTGLSAGTMECDPRELVRAGALRPLTAFLEQFAGAGESAHAA